ncbi:helix-turn-helix domain-containing protein [Flavobacterium sp. NKUCC04_CG]|uniref:AraC family transcriptional regulator n=1 Tax=Flavobacterium sp. NKUCC04_CG TaxID=2842121 RepID=UPI001C5AEB75|nr:helix-turn-helix domain-containing protein [Flavobacterium sp. NKUCC04_CG]MBW3520368.1 helix-turn-helix domain-containing protein [Flavobacterium sp. NKUCC04_CG]
MFLLKEEYQIIYVNVAVFLVILIANTWTHNSVVLLMNIAYLLYYTISINRELKRQKVSSKYSNSKNIISILNYFSVFGIIVVVMTLFEKNNYKVFDFNVYVIFIGIMFLCMVFGIIFLKNFQKEISEEEQIQTEQQGQLLLEEYNLKYRQFHLESDSPLAKEILLFYEKSTKYLDVDFNLIDLAQELNCSRAELSEVLNRDMKTGFYSLTGRYRINYAKKLLLKKDNYTIEALMAQCGFHSKSTFNKYFKEFVGMRPSVYRKVHANIKKT